MVWGGDRGGAVAGGGRQAKKSAPSALPCERVGEVRLRRLTTCYYLRLPLPAAGTVMPASRAMASGMPESSNP